MSLSMYEPGFFLSKQTGDGRDDLPLSSTHPGWYGTRSVVHGKGPDSGQQKMLDITTELGIATTIGIRLNLHLQSSHVWIPNIEEQLPEPFPVQRSRVDREKWNPDNTSMLLLLQHVLRTRDGFIHHQFQCWMVALLEKMSWTGSGWRGNKSCSWCVKRAWYTENILQVVRKSCQHVTVSDFNSSVDWIYFVGRRVTPKPMYIGKP